MSHQVLESLLVQLHGAEEEYQQLALVGNIEQCVKRDMSRQEQSVALGLLAGTGANSLVLQVKGMKDAGEAKVKVAILKLLQDYLHTLGDRITPFASNLQNVCFYILCKSSSVSVKNRAFPLFQDIQKLRLDLEHVAGAAEYHPPQFFIKQLFKELQLSKSKLGQTVRGMMLATLGLLGTS